MLEPAFKLKKKKKSLSGLWSYSKSNCKSGGNDYSLHHNDYYTIMIIHYVRPRIQAFVPRRKNHATQ